MKKLVAGVVLTGSCLCALAPMAVNADVNGSDAANITVNGTLGVDNKKPDAPIEEESDAWINVTLDTATVFYNVAGQKTIESPVYNIKNNSGRPVNVSLQSFTNTASTDVSEFENIERLDLTYKRGEAASGSTTNLITTGSVLGDKSGAPISLLELANNEGKMTDADTGTAETNKATFGYEGSVDNENSTESNPQFEMTLHFDVPAGWVTPQP